MDDLILLGILFFKCTEDAAVAEDFIMRIFYNFLEQGALALHTFRRWCHCLLALLELLVLLVLSVLLSPRCVLCRAFAQTLKCNLHKFHSFFRLYRESGAGWQRRLFYININTMCITQVCRTTCRSQNVPSIRIHSLHLYRSVCLGAC